MDTLKCSFTFDHIDLCLLGHEKRAGMIVYEYMLKRAY